MISDVIVVGGGVIGCSIALKLVQQGLKVSVIERGRIGCEASRAAAGMLLPQTETAGPGPFFDLCMRSRAMYPEFARLLHELSGIDPEYREEGTLVVQLSDGPHDHINEWTSWQIEAGLALEALDAGAINRIEPAVTKLATSALFVPGDHQIDNRRLMDALAASLKSLGVELIEGEEVEALALEGEKVTGGITRRGILRGGAVVIASGCWSGRLLERAGVEALTIPARGQMIALKGTACPIRHVLYSGQCYLAPRRDGRVVVGSTVEYVGFRKGVTARGIGSLIAGAVELLPELTDFEIVETWSGLRPDTADHLPILGLTGIGGLYLATGHFRNGILLAPITSELMTELITTERAADGLAPFGVDRFLR